MMCAGCTSLCVPRCHPQPYTRGLRVLLLHAFSHVQRQHAISWSSKTHLLSRGCRSDLNWELAFRHHRRHITSCRT